MKAKSYGFAIAALSVAVLSGCANNGPQGSAHNSLDADTDRIAQLEAELDRLRHSGPQGLTPPNPKAGECYARVLTPATFETRSHTIETVAPSQRIETTKAKYINTTQRVIATEESSRLQIIPATFKTVTDTIIVQEASTRLVQTAATFRTVSEKILVSPARTEWKKGRGPIQKIDTITGEIMCLVEVPAVYKTITKRILEQPASVRSIEVPARTKTISRRVVDQPATTRSVTVAATYKDVHIHKLLQAASQHTINIPGQTKTISQRIKVLDSQLEWRSILCETNTNGDVVRRLQRALRANNYNPGPIDGILGRETLAAVNSYQKANDLASGQLTIATLRKLGVSQ
ncbi:MAG: hypothetical protein OFPII_27270 [Osedax symbiont Rs1]|nr:MAG: hypothetical protein OFPII_27270 [Osedax symbiont Rs1]